MEPNEVLALAAGLSQKIRDRRPKITEAVDYYRGAEGRLRFASDEFRGYFEKRFRGFTDNWCMPVAQAPIERIHYLGMRLGEERTADLELERDWERNDAQRGLSEALLMMTVARRSFALVSPTAAGPRITFENPDSAAVAYDSVTRARKAGLVMWSDDNYEYGELHLPRDVINVKRPRDVPTNGDTRYPPMADGWVFDERGGAISRPNPLGSVALVEFRNQSLLDNDPISDIAGVMAMQDSINLVWAYLLNALDYASMPGRVILNGEIPTEPILDQDGQQIGEQPIELDALVRERIAWLQGENVKIDQWSPATLDAYSKVIEQAVEHIAAQTRTPGHYLLSKSNVPATGYELAEAGLVSKAQERISYATSEVREINRLTALARGETAKAEQIAVGKVLWRKPQFRSEMQLMDGLLKMRQAGFPFQWIAEEYGLAPSEVDRVMQMVRDEQTDPYLAAMGQKEAVSGTDAAASISGP